MVRTPVLTRDQVEHRGDSWPQDALEDIRVEAALSIGASDLLKALRRSNGSAPSPKEALALARYVKRMSTRCTPFGLFAAVAVGRVVGEGAALRFRVPYLPVLHTRLDMGMLERLCSYSPASVPRSAVFEANDSIWWRSGRIQYFETNLVAGDRRRKLSTVWGADSHRAFLEYMRIPRCLAALQEQVVEAGWTAQEAETYVNGLVEAQLLIPVLRPRINGSPALPEQGDWPYDTPEGVVRSCVTRAEDMKRLPLGEVPAALEGLRADASRVAGVSTRVAAVQVDAHWPATAEAHARVTEHIGHSVEQVMALLGRPDNRLSTFGKRFRDRYGDVDVPLHEVVDPELGLWPTEVLEDRGSDVARLTPGALARALATVSSGVPELVLSSEDFLDADGRGDRVLARVSAFSAIVSFLSDPAGEEPMFHLHGLSGPGSADLLTRFAFGAEHLHQAILRLNEMEQQACPEVPLVEVVHLPEGRAGNVVFRPSMRPSELHFLGDRAFAEGEVLDAADVSVFLHGEYVRLRHRSTGRVFRPRFTSAYNPLQPKNLPLFSFLGSVAVQDRVAIAFRWGDLLASNYFPRLRIGAAVLAPARWVLNPDETKRLLAGDFDGRWRELAASRALPQRFTVGHSDNRLLIDTAHDLDFLELKRQVRASGGSFVIAEELESTWHLGSEAGEPYSHELVFPFVRKEPIEEVLPPPRPAVPSDVRWLYVKLYTSVTLADAVVRKGLADLVTRIRRRDETVDWFFLRYSDPDFHLRVRVRVAEDGDRGDMWTEVDSWVRELQSAGLIDRIVWADYTPETWRYGGPDAMALAERLFSVDSELVARVAASDTDDPSVRARVALTCIDRIYRFGGLDTRQIWSLLEGALSAVDRSIIKRWNKSYRDWRAVIRDLGRSRAETYPLVPDELTDGMFSWCNAFGAALQAYQELETNGGLCRPLREILPVFVHMHVNRLSKADPNENERCYLHWLRRWYREVLATEGSDEARATTS